MSEVIEALATIVGVWGTAFITIMVLFAIATVSDSRQDYNNYNDNDYHNYYED